MNAASMSAVRALLHRPRAITRPRATAWIRAAVGIAILVVVVVQVGGQPLLAALAAVTPLTIGAAFALTAAATLAASWRWRVAADRLGVPLGRSASVAAYYRSMLLDAVLPGGVVGDVHRAVAHGRDAGRAAPAARAVAAERVGGQVVQLVVAGVVLAVLGVRSAAPLAGALAGVVALIVVIALLVAAAVPRSRAAIVRELREQRRAFGSGRAATALVVSSVAVVACHCATFVVVALAAGVRATPDRLVAVALLTVLAAGIPLGVGGWGPRETGAAWAFGASGIDPSLGVATAAAYGIVCTLAVLPGLLVLWRPVRLATPDREHVS